MAKYKHDLANKTNVEFVHVSQDTKVESASLWAKTEDFPWLTVLPQDIKRSGLEKFIGNNGVPFFAIVTADGRMIGSGHDANQMFTKASKL